MDSVLGPRKGRLIVLSDLVLKAVLDCLRLSAWVAGKWRPRSWCTDELLKAPALVGGEERPLLRHCIVTSESGSLAGWRTVRAGYWLLTSAVVLSARR